MSADPIDAVLLETAKLVFAGPVGAGKTTAIRSISDSEPISTDVPLSDGPMGEKTTTTVALDFATVNLEDGTPLLVYGLPGQAHFSFMRPIIINGAVGVILMLNGREHDAAAYCTEWLDSIRGINEDIAIVIGITHSDLVPGFSLGPIREAVRRSGRPVPIFTFDARSRPQSAHLVRALLVSAQAA